ncbi:Cpi1p [Cyanidiococcus yangmingshanensis]|uniref:Cpi1p n=1 Tax=Cyanidiococcus yangmingshanensis TaxID=2690220 RepID=A0A7J7INL0_9RHOD|nr:Cpi1p [Cyanidiococcus yangmingshanensis]
MWARDPSKSWAEHYFLLVCPVAIGFLLIGIVATGWYRQLDRLGYTLVFERALVVVLLAYGTALAETVTIAAFPHYRFRDWHRMVLFGSAFYGLYFIVSFPMYYRLDEVDEMTRVPLKRDEKRLLSAASRWTLGQVILDALAAAMIVTILLDIWRLAIGGIGKGLRAPTNPWMGIA